MKMKRRDSRRERKIAIGLVVGAVLAVVFATIMTFYFSPENRATRELERMAKEYYETYLYGSSVATFENGAEGLAEFSEEGFRPIKLRQLILYNGGKNRGSQSLFETETYKCNLDQSEIVYRPFAPYGVTDYTVEYKTECKNKA